jgi:uncharacterized membrane protein YbhN (UPF0104 family)
MWVQAAGGRQGQTQYELVRENLREIASKPAKLQRLFGANLCSQLLFAWSLGLCLHAYGGSASVWVLILVNTAASLFGGLAPVPGGMGVMEGPIITVVPPGRVALSSRQGAVRARTFLVTSRRRL